MGHSLDFLCPACDLRGHVSGGEDAGMMVLTTTIYCETCGTLQDAVTREYGLNEEPKEIAPRCRKRAKHRIRLWTKDEPCPRCGKGLLIPDPNGMECLWD